MSDSNSPADAKAAPSLQSLLRGVDERWHHFIRQQHEDTPDAPREAYYSSIVAGLVRSGEGQHQDLTRVVHAVYRHKFVDPDPASDSHCDFRDMLVSEYGLGHDNAERQVDEAIAKVRGAREMSEGVKSTFAEKSDLQRAERNTSLLAPFAPTRKDELEALSPFADPGSLHPGEFLERAFTRFLCQTKEKVLVAIAEESHHEALIMHPHQEPDELEHPAAAVCEAFAGQFGPGWDKFQFVSQAAFKARDGRRRLDNMSVRPYVVFEVDFSGQQHLTDLFTSFVLSIREFIPLVAIVDTGGKSLHFWIANHAKSLDERKVMDALRVHAANRGADKAILTNDVALVRLPNVEGGEGRRPQRLLYFDPSQAGPQGRPIDIGKIDELLISMIEVPMYYDGGSFILEAENGDWITMNKDLAKVHLSTMGIPVTRRPGEELSRADEVLKTVMVSQNISGSAKSVAGFHSGIHELGGKFYHVFQGSQFPPIQNKRVKWGDFPAIAEHLEYLFDDDGLDHHLACLQLQVRAAHNGGKRIAEMRPTPYTILVGPSGTGKTFYMNNIVARLLGAYGMPSGVGTADAKDLFDQKNRSQFNDAALAWMLSMIDDGEPYLLPGIENRREQADLIKRLYDGTGGVTIHSKNIRKDVHMKPVIFGYRLMNPDSLHMLPDLSSPSIANRILLIRLLDNPERDTDWYSTSGQKAIAEVPRFFRYLHEDYKPEKHIVEGNFRSGIRPYVSPELAHCMESDDGTDAAYLSRLIRTHVMTVDKVHKGKNYAFFTTSELRSHLLAQLTKGEAIEFKKRFQQAGTGMSGALKEMERLNPGSAIHSDDKDAFPPLKRSGIRFYRIQVTNKLTDQ